MLCDGCTRVTIETGDCFALGYLVGGELRDFGSLVGTDGQFPPLRALEQSAPGVHFPSALLTGLGGLWHWPRGAAGVTVL